MKRFVALAVLLAASMLFAGVASAQQKKADLRLYIMDCGQGHAPDKARWSPGVEVGVPWDISDNCYLIRHGSDLMLWDTGITDKLQPGPAGQTSPIQWSKPKKLIGQLAGLGITPDDIKIIAVSHTHPDHIGNVDLFPKAQLLIQKAEYDWAFSDNKKPFSPEHPVKKLESDYDVFGDGTVEIIQTPGHTPGHESLLLHLPKTGWVLLSGDAVHFKSNWENRRIPAGNTDKQATLVSMQRMSDIMQTRHAKLWINHDKAQSKTLKYAPNFYE